MSKKISVNIGATVRDIVLSDVQATKVETAIAKNYKYKEEIETVDGEIIPNPKSKDEFVKDIISNFLEENVNAYEASEATKEAINNLTKFKI